jgi:formate/nitrite transporter FocA (FNT family)
VSIAPDPEEMFDRAVEEGERRLDQSTLEFVATGFTAGITVVFGVVALGVVHGALEGRFGHAAHVGGALAFEPFDHVIVTVLHVVFGTVLGADVGLLTLVDTTASVLAGNLVGGLGLVTLTHVAQAERADESDG